MSGYGSLQSIDPSVIWSHPFKNTNSGATLIRYAPATGSYVYGSLVSTYRYGTKTMLEGWCINGSPILFADRSYDDPIYPNETILNTGFDPTPYKDFSYQTYAEPAPNPTVNVAPGELRELVLYDLGAQEEMLVFIDARTGNTYAYIYMDFSPDCTNYTRVIVVNGANVRRQRVYHFASQRCIKLSVYNASSITYLGTNNFLIYEFEIYRPRMLSGTLQYGNKRWTGRQDLLASIPFNAADACILRVRRW